MHTWSTLQDRPDLSRITREYFKQPGTLGIAVCGPSPMVVDVRNAVAEGQFRIATGGSVITECFLHTEEFNW